MSEGIKVEAVILDPEDGEAGIVDVYSGRVLGRFLTMREAAAYLRAYRSSYEAKADRLAAMADLAAEARRLDLP